MGNLYEYYVNPPLRMRISKSLIALSPLIALAIVGTHQYLKNTQSAVSTWWGQNRVQLTLI